MHDRKVIIFGATKFFQNLVIIYSEIVAFFLNDRETVINKYLPHLTEFAKVIFCNVKNEGFP